MADDARTEARHRIAAAIDDAPWPCPHGGINSTDPGDWFSCLECRADAVLELFPEIEVEEWGQYADGSWPQPAHSFPNFIEPTHRRLILRGPVEPVVPEESQP